MIASGDTSHAIETIHQRIAANPKDAEARVLLANALLKKAMMAAEKLPRRSDGSPAPITGTEADTIAKELEAAIALVPERRDLYLGLVELAETADRKDEMIRQAERAAKAFPVDSKMTQGLLRFATDALERRDNALAQRLFETIYNGYPKTPEAIVAWASELLNLGQLDRAMDVLRAGATAAPRSAIVAQALGDASCYRLDFQTATNSYAKGVSLDPTNVSLRLAWAAALHVSDPQAAKTIAEPLWGKDIKSLGSSSTPMVDMTSDPNDKPETRVANAGAQLTRALVRPNFGAFDAYSLARSFWSGGFPAQAIAETEVALQKDPTLAEAQVLRAEMLSRIGLGAEALEAAVKAEATMDAAPDRASALTRDEVIASRAAIEAKLGKSEQALATYKRLSDPSRYSYRMGLLAERLGHIEEARALLEATITSGTNQSEIEAARGRLAGETYRKKP